MLISLLNYLYENNQQLPIFKVLTKRKCWSGGYKEDKMPEQLKTLDIFYKEHLNKYVNIRRNY